VGVRYGIGLSVFAKAEFVYRITNTDYLDDVSTEYVDPPRSSMLILLQNVPTRYLYMPSKRPGSYLIVTEGDQRGDPKT